MDMSRISGDSVLRSIESYEKNIDVKKEIFEWSEMLLVMQDEIADLAIELIARYQPVATDLRFIRSCMEIAYGFSRYGKYSFDIVEVLETIGPVTECEKGAVLMMANTIREMILLSINGLQARDKTIAEKLYELDDTVDCIYRTFLRDNTPHIHEKEKADKKVKASINSSDPKCYISAILLLRYLERVFLITLAMLVIRFYT
jgi:phosphate transport system protein